MSAKERELDLERREGEKTTCRDTEQGGHGGVRRGKSFGEAGRKGRGWQECSE